MGKQRICSKVVNRQKEMDKMIAKNELEIIERFEMERRA
jgi:hypothetical protein